ncbi:MAG TPA: very short patch repair endonuclease [Smithellaceae bacterium]|nr:very short patch repair endonuclease [Smithellaceae bacterium]
MDQNFKRVNIFDPPCRKYLDFVLYYNVALLIFYQNTPCGNIVQNLAKDIDNSVFKVDTFSQKKRSWIMAQIKSNGNRSTEMNMLLSLRENKIKGWRRNYPVFGKPDFAFPKHRVAIFIDGCFWHGHPQKCRLPKTNKEYWERKISKNKARDLIVKATLRKKGWRVIRIWEDSVKKPSTISRIRKALQ